MSMSEEAVGAAFAAIFGLAVGISHLIAARDPDRNAITRLIRDHYDHTWPLLGSLPNRQAMMIVGVVAIFVSLLGLGGLINELLK